MEFECRSRQNDIDRLVAGELPEAELAVLLSHVETCDDCREHRAIVEEISEAAAGEPEEEELRAVREAVLRTIRRERRGARVGLAALPHAAAIGLVAGGGLLLALGWAGGRATAAGESRPVALFSRGASPEVVLASQIRRAARQNEVLEDVENSPFRYTNVRIEPGDGERVRLSFDVSRHLELTLPKSDPLVTEVLVQSMLEAGSIGTQLRAIDQAGSVLDPRIRGALIKAMLHDPNLGVRLQAQERLIDRPGDPEIADALLTVLENEESVQMRLIAIDYLTRSRIDPARLSRAVEAGEPEGRGAVRVRARDYILGF